MTKDIAIKVEDVSKNFQLPHLKSNSVKHLFTGIFGKDKKSTETQHALRDISFEVKKGEFFGIVGRNGSGKSTMLKIIAKIYEPTKGSISINGKLVPFIELGVGFNPELSGRENVYLNGALLGFTKQQIDKQYEDIVAFAELEQFMDQKLKNYSSGMQVRLAFSVATRANADILLVDEVLAVGDADFQRKCYDFFGELKKTGKTVIFVTHDMNAVKEYCDTAILIEDSKIVAGGTAGEVANKYTRLFLSNTTVDREIDHKVSRWGEGTIRFDQILMHSDVVTEGEDLVFDISFQAIEDVKDPVVGFTIKNASGQAITGTNSLIKQLKIDEMKKGEVRNLECRLPNVFSDGKFIIDVAAASKSGKIYEWWEEASVFRSKRTEHIPYSVQPDIELRIINSKND